MWVVVYAGCLRGRRSFNLSKILHWVMMLVAHATESRCISFKVLVINVVSTPGWCMYMSSTYWLCEVPPTPKATIIGLNSLTSLTSIPLSSRASKYIPCWFCNHDWLCEAFPSVWCQRCTTPLQKPHMHSISHTFMHSGPDEPPALLWLLTLVKSSKMVSGFSSYNSCYSCSPES